MKIAAKEASESLYWLSVCEKSGIAGFQHELIGEINQIIAILSSNNHISKEKYVKIENENKIYLLLIFHFNKKNGCNTFPHCHFPFNYHILHFLQCKFTTLFMAHN